MKRIYILLIIILVVLIGCYFVLTISVKNISEESRTLPPPKYSKIYVVSHRGAHDHIPENTLPAYQKAIDMGVDFVEVDIRTTKDGEIVSCHNSRIDAYTEGKTGNINDFTLNELKQIDIGKKSESGSENVQIPTLEEILQICQGKCGVYLDLKEAPVEKIVQLLKKYNMKSYSIWYSPTIRFRTFYKLKRHCPECIPMPDPVYTLLLPFTLAIMKPRIIATAWDSFSPDFAKSCQDAGALTIMDESNPSSEEWQKAIDWGVNGIQTDNPTGLIEFLKNK
ncbi:glycerophosphodiester phosphodiesterase [Bacteroidota bacterium]